MQKFDWTVIFLDFIEVTEKKENRERQFFFSGFIQRNEKILSIWFRSPKND
ncbi:hypothetical protein LEP1GSC116_0669 [Leptospira interrogans serovar Icterohaemorrhagiae str. Verdun HP]|uniref:Uncharacterized protein n=1 Tax=Leptospira interrogans serovar Icterohaemorrhagiae str. Verdun HP TaxID=1049910 RepID=M6RLC4_LEPIR|nr:hypothetical protein LEP1GSC116_0669 [Leptospira interrogans serovar Icterohaemorrhagiae str. Verdun HP]